MSYSLWTEESNEIVHAGMVEEDDHPIPIKSLNWHAQNIASESQSPAPGLHVIDLFGTNRRRDERRVSGAFR